MTPEERAEALAAVDSLVNMAGGNILAGRRIEKMADIVRKALTAEPMAYAYGVRTPETGVFRMHSEKDARTYAAEVAGRIPVRKALGPWEDLPTDKNVSEETA